VADPLSKILLGLLTGLLFGFFLQKAHVTKRDVIVGQFRLRDFTVMKTMLTAICVGGIGVYLLRALGMAQLHPKPAQLGAVIVGGLIFGVGMVVLGYCPGTGVAAAAEGRKDAWFGVLGMMAGALIFAEIYAPLQVTLVKVWDLGPVTLPELTSIPAWVFFAVLSLGAWFLFRWLTGWEQRRNG
jgi:uncharacterized protein